MCQNVPNAILSVSKYCKVKRSGLAFSVRILVHTLVLDHCQSRESPAYSEQGFPGKMVGFSNPPRLVTSVVARDAYRSRANNFPKSNFHNVSPGSAVLGTPSASTYEMYNL